MKIALISDIHSNLEALTAVLEKIDSMDVDAIFALGDTVGYGPDPEACLRIAMERFQVVLMGNHEHAVLNGPKHFTALAKKAMIWTQKQLDKPELMDYIRCLKPAWYRKPWLCVHGSIRHPLLDYVRDLSEQGHEGYLKLLETFEQDFQEFDICFVGHNHRTFMSTKEGDIFPHDDISRFNIKDQKCYVSIGSVGQPRDGDNRSSFVIFDGEYLEYHRVSYDVETTTQKIKDAGLPDFLAERLWTGA